MAMSNAERQRKFRDNRDKDQQRRQIYLASERQRYKKDKESGKKSSTKDLSERERRILRRKWRKQKAVQKKREKDAKRKLENLLTPPMSPETPQNPREASSRQKKQHAKKMRREQAKCYRDKASLQRDLENTNRKLLMYKKRCDRLQNLKKDCLGDTPRSKTRRLLRNASKKIVRKTLLFHAALLDQMKVWYKKKKRNQKNDLATMLSGPILRKYKFKSTAWHACGVQVRRNQSKHIHNCLSIREKMTIRNFYERDDVSRLMTGMKKTVTYKKQTKQRRVLTDTLKHTYLKYISEGNTNVSFTTFYRLRPFWVIFPKPSDRSTCLCKLCENTQFMLSALKTAKAIDSDSTENFVKHVACDITSQTCMHGKCTTCKSIRVPYDKSRKDTETKWVQWITKTERRKIKKRQEEVEKDVSYTVKQIYNGSVTDLLEWLDKSIDRYKKHYFNIRNQYEHFRQRKENLMNNECIIHVDFSENFVCKYSEEIQSMHFGASKKQLSLHTGVYYVGQEKHHTFCTVTEDLNHGPGAIWAHLEPVLVQISNTYPQVDTLEFFSDGPTVQYRQKGNFFLLTTKPTEFGFEHVSWSFFEAGHGKGVPDAVGGAVKRTADGSVKYGKDIASGEDFIKAVSGSAVDCILVPVEDIVQGVSSASKQRLQAVKGTMNLHQVFSISEGVVMYRDTSCSCTYPNECSEHTLKKANLLLKRKESTPQRKDTNDTESNVNAKPSQEKTLKRRRTQPRRNQFDIILEDMERCTSYEMLQEKCEEIEKCIEPLTKVSEFVSFTTQPLEPDVQAMDMIPADIPDKRTLYPCQVDANGNCLPSCGSVHAFGRTTESSEIRARIVCELVLNEERYLNSNYLSRGTEDHQGKPKNWPYLYTQYSDVYVPGIHLSDDIVQYFYRLEVFKIRKDKSFMGMWQLHALAEVLNMPVYSVYPKLGAACVRQDYHRVVYPSTDERCADTPAYILWTSTRDDMKREHWVPNHFVPLLPIDIEDDGTEVESVVVETSDEEIEKKGDGQPRSVDVEGSDEEIEKKGDGQPRSVDVEGSDEEIEKKGDGQPRSVDVEGSDEEIEKKGDGQPRSVDVEGCDEEVEKKGYGQPRSVDVEGCDEEVEQKGDGQPRSVDVEGSDEEVEKKGYGQPRSVDVEGCDEEVEQKGDGQPRSVDVEGSDEDIEQKGDGQPRSVDVEGCDEEIEKKGDGQTGGVDVEGCEVSDAKVKIEGYTLKVPSPKRCIGKYVVINYNGVPYPGRVNDVSETQLLVECMHRVSKIEKNDFFWPKKIKDIEWYDHDNVIAMIPEPQPILLSSHSQVHPVAWNEILGLGYSKNG